MRIVTWNTFGIRTALPNLQMMLKSCTPDVVCLQETKIRDVYANFDFKGYQQYWNESTDFAHLGTALLSKSSSLVAVTSDNFDVYYDKGNVIVAELKETYVVCVYVPYAGTMGITRDNRHCWYKCFQSLIHQLQQNKPCIICGDFNVVQHEEDTWDKAAINTSLACFTAEERVEVEKFVQEEQLVDVYRYLYSDTESEGFTYFPFGAEYRKNKKGYRIDLFLISKQLINKVVDCYPLQDVEGSCNVPLLLDIDI